MNNKIPLDPKVWQLMECLIPNLIGLYIDSYFGCALSVICLLWHWTGDKTDRTSTPVSYTHLTLPTNVNV